MFTNLPTGKSLLIPALTAVAAALSGADAARASTVSFDSPPALDNYSLFRSNSPDPAIEVVAGAGVGDPAGGGLRVTGSSSSKRVGLLLLPEISGVGDKTRWTSSILISPREVSQISTGEKSAQIRLGFAATRNTSNIEKFFTESNHAVSLLIKAEHKTSDAGKQRLLEFEGSSRAATETKFGKFTVNNAAYFGEWLRATLELVRTGSSTFHVTFTIESLGTNGTDTPVLRHSHTQADVVNASLASAASLHAGFSVQTDKSANNRIFFDDHSVSLAAEAPAAPTAQPASSITTSAAIANWAPAPTGAPATGFVVEVTTAADAFAPGTFLAADGTGGQSAGIQVAGGSTASQALAGLSQNTAYVYRIRAMNAAGESPASEIISFTTASEFVNSPPTLDDIPGPLIIPPDAGSHTVNLTGIGMGIGDSGQTLTVSAVSSDQSVLPDPSVLYNSPSSTGALILEPTGLEGTAVISVTVDDGYPLDAVTRAFTVIVRSPASSFGFEDSGDFALEFQSDAANAVYALSEGNGTGTPASGALAYRSANSIENAGLFLRSQPYRRPPPSSMTTSLLLNLREIDDHLAGKHKAEIRLGFANEASPVPSDRRKFFEQGGATRRAVQVRLSAEHEPGKKDREIKIRASSHIGNSKSESPEATVSGNPDAFEHWLRLSLQILPTSSTNLSITYRLEDMGPDGSSEEPELLASGTFLRPMPTFWPRPGIFRASF